MMKRKLWTRKLGTGTGALEKPDPNPKLYVAKKRK